MKRWLVLVLVSVLGLTVLFGIDHYYRAQNQQENDRELSEGLHETTQRLEEGISLRILVVEDLNAFILASPMFPESENFDRYAALALSNSPEMRALQYVDSGHIIRYTYPLEGNEAALGLDLMTRPAAPFVEKAIQTRTITVNDPTVTVQGSLSIVARSPIYDGDRYLGLAQGVFDITSLLEL